MSISTIPDHGIAVVQVGTAFNAAFTIPLGTTTYTLSRKPAGSSASLAGSTLTPDVSGLYQLTCVNAGITRNVNVVAAPSGVFALKVNAGSPVSGLVTLGHLVTMLVVENGKWSAATFAASGSVETSPGAGFGFNPVLLGGTKSDVTLNFGMYGN